MGIGYQISHEEQLATVLAEGRINLSECVKAIEDLGKDETFDPSYNVLVDLRNMEYSPSTGDAYAIVLTLRRLKTFYQGRIGLVVSGTFLFGMARMTGLLAEAAGFSMVPFQDYDLAYQWVRYGNLQTESKTDTFN